MALLIMAVMANVCKYSSSFILTFFWFTHLQDDDCDFTAAEPEK